MIRWFILGVVATGVASDILHDLDIRVYQAKNPYKEEVVREDLGDGWGRFLHSPGEAYPPAMIALGKNPDDRGVIHFPTVSIHVYGADQWERAKVISRMVADHPELWKVDLPEYRK